MRTALFVAIAVTACATARAPEAPPQGKADNPAEVQQPLAKTEPAKTEPAAPAQPETPKTEPAAPAPTESKPEAKPAEPAKTEPKKTEPAKTEPAKTATKAKPAGKPLDPKCPSEGKQAPPFSLLMADGSEGVSLRAGLEKKKPIVLGFWAHWCVPCKAELPVLERMSKEMAGKVTFLLVHVGPDESKMKEKLKELGISIRSASDDTAKRQEKYCAFELPLTLLIKPDGNVKARYQGLHVEEFEQALRIDLKELGVG